MLAGVEVPLALDRGMDHDVQLPALVRLEREVERDRAPVDPRGVRQRDTRAEVAGRCLEHQLAPLLVVRRGRRRRQWQGVLGVPEREVVELDGDDVREVGLELQRELELELLHALVPHGDPLPHAGRDEALAGDGEGVVRQAVDARVAEKERGREVVGAPRREEQWSRAVETQDEPG